MKWCSRGQCSSQKLNRVKNRDKLKMAKSNHGAAVSLKSESSDSK